MTNTRGAEINQRFDAVNGRIDTLHAMMEELLARTKPPASPTQGGGQQPRVVTTNNMFSALEDVNDEDAEDAVIAETIDDALATNGDALAKSDGKNTQAGADATSKGQAGTNVQGQTDPKDDIMRLQSGNTSKDTKTPDKQYQKVFERLEAMRKERKEQEGIDKQRAPNHEHDGRTRDKTAPENRRGWGTNSVAKEHLYTRGYDEAGYQSDSVRSTVKKARAQPKVTFSGRRGTIVDLPEWMDAIRTWAKHHPELDDEEIIALVIQQNLTQPAQELSRARARQARRTGRPAWNTLHAFLDWITEEFPDERTLEEVDEAIERLDPNAEKFHTGGLFDAPVFTSLYDSTCDEAGRTSGAKISGLMRTLQWFCPEAYEHFEDDDAYIALNKAKGPHGFNPAKVTRAEWNGFRRRVNEYFTPTRLGLITTYKRTIKEYVSETTPSSPKRRFRKARRDSTEEKKDSSFSLREPTQNTYNATTAFKTLAEEQKAHPTIQYDPTNRRGCPLCGEKDWRTCGGWWKCTNTRDPASSRARIRSRAKLSQAATNAVYFLDGLFQASNEEADEAIEQLRATHCAACLHLNDTTESDVSDDTDSGSEDY